MKHPGVATNTLGNTPTTSAAPLTKEPEAEKSDEMSEGIPRPRLDVYYIVLRPFKYNGVRQLLGKEWLPTGCPFDGKIVAHGRLVKRVEKVIEAAEAARRRPKPKEDEEDVE